ncbi:MAG TPA: Crp/Fnr family transcriptional regulator [Terriglobales bacterium]|jgi:CRP-like cAMP-binding protein|nr:Crp/Fnr family transcriptional regulator [Terriglobales bacterium]
MAMLNVVPSRPEPLQSGTRTDASGKPVKNVILLSLPDCEFRLLRPHLEPVDLSHHLILNEAGDRINFAYFLNEGMTSLVVVTRNGQSVEVGLVGREGMVGMPVAVGLRRGSFRAIIQISGAGLRIRSEKLEECLHSTPELRLILSRYVLVHGLQVGQVAACNRLHEIGQRLARWLLMCQDRVDSPLLRLTHEFLAQMLGTGRPSVSLAVSMLEQGGMIENKRGVVRIVNRNQLELASCECYGVIQDFNVGLGLR